MKIIVDIPNYDGNGLDVIWETGSKYSVSVEANNVVISANKSGLVSLAKQMLYMAYNNLTTGSHIHYDSFFTRMTDEDFELVIEKEVDL